MREWLEFIWDLIKLPFTKEFLDDAETFQIYFSCGCGCIVFIIGVITNILIIYGLFLGIKYLEQLVG